MTSTLTLFMASVVCIFLRLGHPFLFVSSSVHMRFTLTSLCTTTIYDYQPFRLGTEEGSVCCGFVCHPWSSGIAFIPVGCNFNFLTYPHSPHCWGGCSVDDAPPSGGKWFIPLFSAHLYHNLFTFIFVDGSMHAKHLPRENFRVICVYDSVLIPSLSPHIRPDLYVDLVSFQRQLTTPIVPWSFHESVPVNPICFLSFTFLMSTCMQSSRRSLSRCFFTYSLHLQRECVVVAKNVPETPKTPKQSLVIKFSRKRCS